MDYSEHLLECQRLVKDIHNATLKKNYVLAAKLSDDLAYVAHYGLNKTLLEMKK